MSILSCARARQPYHTAGLNRREFGDCCRGQRYSHSNVYLVGADCVRLAVVLFYFMVMSLLGRKDGQPWGPASLL